jgi:hypothetical protein
MPRIWRDDDGDARPKKDDGERERLSWSEIDKRKDRSRHAPDEPRPRQDRKSRATAAYGKYKTELNRLFDSGGIAEKFRDELSGVPKSGKKPETKSLLALKAAEGREFTALFAEHFKKYGLPDDPELLVKGTACKDVKIVIAIIDAVCALDPDVRITGKAAMMERLRSLQSILCDRGLDEAIARLRQKIGG